MKLRVRSLTRRWALLLGWPGAVGALGLALCLALYGAAVVPVAQRLQAARADAGSLAERMAQARRALDQGSLPLDEQLNAFYRIFPSEHDAPEWIGRIAAIARKDGLSLQQAEYRAERDPTGRLTRLRMSVPLRGDYPTLRRFLSDLRTEIPIVSLEQVQFARQKVGDPLVDAQVSLVIFLGRTS